MVSTHSRTKVAGSLRGGIVAPPGWPLLASGAVPKLEVMRLEKAAAQARADRSQASAQISRIKASIQEGEGQLKKVCL